MRIGFMVAAIFALGSGALAKDYGRPTAILVSPIHEAQIVRGDDGKDHVEYELLVVNVFSEPCGPARTFYFNQNTHVDDGGVPGPAFKPLQTWEGLRKKAK